MVAIRAGSRREEAPVPRERDASAENLFAVLDHVIDGCLHRIVREIRAATFGRHHASVAHVAFDGVLVERVVALSNARRPCGGVTHLGCTGSPEVWQAKHTES